MSLVPYVHLAASLDGRLAGDRVPLDADEVHHLTTVLRLSSGAAIEIADGEGRSARAELDGRAVQLRAAARSSGSPSPHLVLAQALPKGRKFDEVVRQVTELGVHRILPFEAERSVVRLHGPKADKAIARWRAVARAACEQARRPTRPDVTTIHDLPAVVRRIEQPGTAAVVAHPGAPALPNVTGELGSFDEVVVLVGPEGGFSPAELEQLEAAGAHPVGLGATTLRTEHAAAAAVAVLAAGLGHWDLPA